MPKVEWDCHCQSLIVTCLAGNDSFLAFEVVEAGGCNSNRLSDFPINCLCEMDSDIAWQDSGIKISPCRVSRHTVHVEFAIFAADHLISESRQLLVIVVTI